MRSRRRAGPSCDRGTRAPAPRSAGRRGRGRLDVEDRTDVARDLTTSQPTGCCSSSVVMASRGASPAHAHADRPVGEGEAVERTWGAGDSCEAAARDRRDAQAPARLSPSQQPELRLDLGLRVLGDRSVVRGHRWVAEAPAAARVRGVPVEGRSVGTPEGMRRPASWACRTRPGWRLGQADLARRPFLAVGAREAGPEQRDAPDRRGASRQGHEEAPRHPAGGGAPRRGPDGDGGRGDHPDRSGRQRAAHDLGQALGPEGRPRRARDPERHRPFVRSPRRASSRSLSSARWGDAHAGRELGDVDGSPRARGTRRRAGTSASARRRARPETVERLAHGRRPLGVLDGGSASPHRALPRVPGPRGLTAPPRPLGGPCVRAHARAPRARARPSRRRPRAAPSRPSPGRAAKPGSALQRCAIAAHAPRDVDDEVAVPPREGPERESIVPPVVEPAEIEVGVVHVVVRSSPLRAERGHRFDSSLEETPNSGRLRPPGGKGRPEAGSRPHEGPLRVRTTGRADDVAKADQGRRKEILGGKGAGLAEMCRIGLPVPPGFTIATTVCRAFYRSRARGSRRTCWGAVRTGRRRASRSELGRGFGDAAQPAAVSVRSGAAVSMPGMMDTILNLGLNDAAVEGLAKLTGNRRFALDAYRRFIQMFGDVVDGRRPRAASRTRSPASRRDKAGAGHRRPRASGARRASSPRYKEVYRERDRRRTSPRTPASSSSCAIEAVFELVERRPRRQVPQDPRASRASSAPPSTCRRWSSATWATTRGTGVAFTRDPSTGENKFYGEFLMNAQGEDVVAGIRTPRARSSETARSEMPEGLRSSSLEITRDARDATTATCRTSSSRSRTARSTCSRRRTGKRTGRGRRADRRATWSRRGSSRTRRRVLRVDRRRARPAAASRRFDPAAPKTHGARARACPPRPGAAGGKVVFTADEAVERAARRAKQVILVRNETSPEDIDGMHAAAGILTGTRRHDAPRGRRRARHGASRCVAGAGDDRDRLRARRHDHRRRRAATSSRARATSSRIDGAHRRGRSHGAVADA